MLSGQLNQLVYDIRINSFHTLQLSISDMVADFKVLTTGYFMALHPMVKDFNFSLLY
jgi:hypothetical protein